MKKLTDASPKVKVAVTQGNIKQGEKWKKEMVTATLERYAELSRRVKGAQLIVWPETAAPFFFGVFSAFGFGYPKTCMKTWVT